MKNFKITIFLLLALVVSLQAAFVAVLETGADPTVKDMVPLTDRQYLTNVLREQAVKELPASQNYTIMTRENIIAMLPPGKSIEDCEGSCLAETGKNIAADYICQARISSFNGTLTLSAELYETAGNKLIASFNGLGSNISQLLTLVIKKSPEFFRSVKNDIAIKSPTQASTTQTVTVQNVPANQNYFAQASQGDGEYLPPSTKTKVNWPRARLFLHAGLYDAGIGIKLRFSNENGIYMTTDARWVSFGGNQFLYIPALFYLGGNVVHFVTGPTLMANSTNGEDGLLMALGINWDIGRHFGIDALAFLPTKSYIGGSLGLDFRFVF